MRSINAIMKWNAVDTIIFSIEKFISKAADEVKYCNNCGKRIMLSKISSYAKNYANNLVDVKHE